MEDERTEFLIIVCRGYLRNQRISQRETKISKKLLFVVKSRFAFNRREPIRSQSRVGRL